MKTPQQQHWIGQVAAAGKPAYLSIADLIAEDLRTGRLAARDQLPKLRDLAGMLGINYTTAARGYAEARRRGLVDSRAGCGTFARGSSPALPLRGGSGAEMTMNMPPEPRQPELVARLQASAATALDQADYYDLMRYQDFGGAPWEREIAAQWLRRRLPDCEKERVLICPGIHSALAALMSLLARPGEMVCVESLAYPGMKAIAAQLGVKLFGLPLEDDGPSAGAFEEACKNLQPKALFINPTINNPTTTTTTQARRECLADIALHHSVPIIEDDAYGMLPRQAPTPLALLAPELTYYVTGLSKCFGAGLRTAFVRAPNARLAQRLAGALRATTVMASPVTNAIALQAVADGAAEAMLAAIRDESMARQALATRHLAGRNHLAAEEGFHLWLPVTDSWNVLEFASYLRSQGVGVVPAVAFSTDGNPPNAVRVCLGGPMSLGECDATLGLIAETLDHPQHPHATVK